LFIWIDAFTSKCSDSGHFCIVLWSLCQIITWA